MGLLRRIVADDPVARDLLDEVLQENPGGARNPWGRAGKPDADEGIIFDNVQNDSHTVAPTGNAADAALRRLRKDRPDLHERVRAGELSPHAAALGVDHKTVMYWLPKEIPGAEISAPGQPERVIGTDGTRTCPLGPPQTQVGATRQRETGP